MIVIFFLAITQDTPMGSFIFYEDKCGILDITNPSTIEFRPEGDNGPEVCLVFLDSFRTLFFARIRRKVWNWGVGGKNPFFCIFLTSRHELNYLVPLGNWNCIWVFFDFFSARLTTIRSFLPENFSEVTLPICWLQHRHLSRILYISYFISFDLSLWPMSSMH